MQINIKFENLKGLMALEFMMRRKKRKRRTYEDYFIKDKKRNNEK